MFLPLPLVALTAAWLGGLALAAAFPLPHTLLAASALLPGLGLLLWRREPGPRLAFACALVALLGALRYPPPPDRSPLAPYIGLANVRVEGVVVAEPLADDDYTKFRFRADPIVIANAPPASIDSDLLAQLPPFSPVAYGDRLIITGTLAAAPVFADFDYREYLARRGIQALLQARQFRRVAQGQGDPLLSALLTLKAHVRAAIAASLPEPHASVLQGILLGDRSGIPPDLEDAFKRTGTNHILVISGYNLTIVAALFGAMRPGRRWPWRRAVSVLIGIALYTLFVGAEPAVVRAALMAGVIILGRVLARPAHPLNSLALATFLMTLHDPFALSDRGFLLSVTSTLGLILYATPIQSRITGWLERHLTHRLARSIADMVISVLAPTIAAQIMSLPFLLLWSQQLSLVSLPANALILPVQPPLMSAGGLAAALAAIWLPTGRVLMSIPWVLLSWTIGAVEGLAALPFATVPLPLPAWVLWPYYLLVLAATWWFNQEADMRARLRARLAAPPARLWVPPMGLAGIALWGAIAAQPDGRLHVAFLDVGQGDAILITTPRGHQVLIDGGPEPALLLRQLGRHMPFWDHWLDLVIVTSPHADHLTGLIALPQRYGIGAVLDNGTNAPGQLGNAWAEALHSGNVTHLLHAHAGMRIQLEPDIALDVLNPGPLPSDDADNNAIVLRLTWGNASFLFTSDITEAAERTLLTSNQPLLSTVLQVPHHGSASSTSSAFLAAVNPQFALISVGAGNRFGQPAPEVLDRLSGRRLLRTDEHGTVELITDGQVMWVRADR